MVIAPKSKKWRDGYQYEHWPIERHIGWTVVTAGWIDFNLEPRSVMFNEHVRDRLPPGFPMILKDIDRWGYAYTYDPSEGVMRLPVEVLEPWSR